MDDNCFENTLAEIVDGLIKKERTKDTIVNAILQALSEDLGVCGITHNGAPRAVIIARAYSDDYMMRNSVDELATKMLTIFPNPDMAMIHSVGEAEMPEPVMA